MSYVSPNSGRASQPGTSLGTRAGGAASWVPPGHGWKHYLAPAGRTPNPASFQAGGHINLYPELEPVAMPSLALVGLEPGKALLTTYAWDTSTWDEIVLMGWVLERSGSDILVSPPTELERRDADLGGAIQIWGLVNLGDGHLVQVVRADDYVGDHFYHVGLRLLATDSLTQVDSLDIPTSHRTRVAYLYPVTDELLVLIVEYETTVHLIKRDGDTLSVVDTVSMEEDGRRQPLCAIVRGSSILVVWDEWHESGSGVTERPPTQVRPVAFSVSPTALTIIQDHGPMGEFYPWGDEAEDRVGFPIANTHGYSHGTQVSDTTAAWAWVQVDYDSELDSPYPAPVGTAWLTWDGTDVVVSDALVSEVAGVTALEAGMSARWVVPTGDGGYVVVAAIPDRLEPWQPPFDGEVWLIWVTDGQITQEARAFGGPEDWGRLTGAPVLGNEFIRGVGGDDFWIALDEWGENDPFLSFVAMDMS